ncbi:MAG TPA: hypothetical protein PKN75_03175 [Bacteroidia bacterium]|nr:hypothetical protein [Bacteroidia bacterium]HNU32570.1 hypothetical protein [Bacteroidia bacterium]
MKQKFRLLTLSILFLVFQANAQDILNSSYRCLLQNGNSAIINLNTHKGTCTISFDIVPSLPSDKIILFNLSEITGDNKTLSIPDSDDFWFISSENKTATKLVRGYQIGLGTKNNSSDEKAQHNSACFLKQMGNCFYTESTLKENCKDCIIINTSINNSLHNLSGLLLKANKVQLQ